MASSTASDVLLAGLPPDLRDRLVPLLSGAGYRVQTLDRVQNLPRPAPRAVLLPLGPDDDPEVCRRLSGLAPVICLVPEGEAGLKARAFAAGAAEVAPLPLCAPEILARLGLVLSSRPGAASCCAGLLSAALGCLPVMIFAADRDGGVVFFNKEFERVTGYTARDMLEHPEALDLLLPDESGNGGRPRGYDGRQWSLRRKDGAERVVVWSDMTETCPIQGWESWGVGLDVTERIRLDRLRLDVERIARHDLKTPLGAILGFADLLRAEPGIGERGRVMLDNVVSAAERMLRIIESSLALYRLESGAHTLRAEPLDLAATLAELARELGPGQGYTGAALDLRVKGPCLVLGELPLVETLLANLLKNALEAAPAGTRVTVDLEDGPQAVRVRVRNRGAVPEAIRERLFEPFVTHGKARGVGLGTYAARLAARAHGGDVVCETSEEEGTTMTVTLPRRPPAAAPL